MAIFGAAAIFVLIAIAGAVVGLRVWVRPQEAIERVTGTVPTHEELPVHPSLVFHDLVKKLGNVMPVSPKDAGVIQRRMIRAGIRNENAMKIFYGSKVLLAVIFPLVMVLAVAKSEADPSTR